MNSITNNLSLAPNTHKLQRGTSSQGGSSFENMLVDSLQQVNGMQLQADQAVEAMFTGEDVNPAEVLTAVQKADLAFQLTMQLRNKAMDVYREIRDIRI
jgi:flagellar hook-basal body complex protein FliE